MQLPSSLRNSPLNRYSHDQLGTGLLLAASLLVGVAIASPDAIGRAINGVSGILWMLGAALLVLSVRDDPRFWGRFALVAGIGMILVLLVKPSDLLMALAGFGLAGAVIGAGFGPKAMGWAKVLPALWLPEHLLTAAVRAAYRAIRDIPATIRTDPPPTAALVPFAMVAAAWAGASLAIWLTRKRSGRS